MLADLDPGVCSSRRKAPDEPCRVQHAVGWVEDRARIPSVERRRELVMPLRREASRPERLVLGSELLPLLFVRGQSKASSRSKGVSCDLRELDERGLRPPPEGRRSLAADRLDEYRVRSGAP